MLLIRTDSRSESYFIIIATINPLMTTNSKEIMKPSNKAEEVATNVQHRTLSLHPAGFTPPASQPRLLIRFDIFHLVGKTTQGVRRTFCIKIEKHKRKRKPIL